MEKKSRVHQLIEAELRKHLSFTFSMEENLSSPGSPVFGSGDTVRFRVWVRNDADVRFNRVAGLLSGTVASSFRTKRFEIHDLEPWQERPVAVIQAKILADPHKGNGNGWIAKLTVVASLELPEIEICESERFLGYTAGRSARPTRSRPNSVPLSDAPPYANTVRNAPRRKYGWS
jgi:hypothetical protein